MNEKLEIDDSFEENEKESEKIKDNEIEKDNNYNFNNNNILDQPPDEINIVTMKTTKTIKCPDDEYNKNYQNRIQMMTKSIIIRLVKISIILFIFTGIEFLGSYFSNSIGVLTISAVLFTDLIKFTITIISILIIENPANDIMTFGYFRSEIIASLCSMLIVLVLSIWICTNAARKILEPRQLNGGLMIIFSFLGLFFNIVVRYIKGLGPVPDVDEGKFLNNFDKSNEMENDLNTPLLDDYLKLEDKESLKSRALLEKITRMNLTKLIYKNNYFFKIRAEEEEEIPANNLQTSANKMAPKAKHWTIIYKDACPLIAFGSILFADVCKLFEGISSSSSALILKK